MNRIQSAFLLRVAHELVDQGMNNRALCKAAGISEAQWSEIRKGSKSITVAMMITVAETLGLKAEIKLSPARLNPKGARVQ